MAIDNLNYYSAWLPAGQQTDRYSSQPWCLRSKNLDIFSSSKSVKATAWSEPTTVWTDIIKQDRDLILKTDWKVYDISTWTEVLVDDPSANFPVYKVCYDSKNGTYEDAIFWTVQDMVAKYEWDEWRSYVVFTDRSSFVYGKQKFVFSKSFEDITNISLYSDSRQNNEGYQFRRNDENTASASISINMEEAAFWVAPIRIFATENASNDATISLATVTCYKRKYYYDAQLDWMTAGSYAASETITFTWDITTWSWVTIEVPTPSYIELKFNFTQKPWASTYKWQYGRLYIDMNWWPDEWAMMKLSDGTKSDWDCNYYYTYLPIRDRKLVSVWDYGYSESFWMKGTSFQPLYKWTSSWLDVGWDKKLVYDFVTDMGWETDVSMDIVDMMIWNEQVYMIGNMDWNWYIIPCDLTWWRWTPYIAYGCEFKWVVNIDYLMYLVWEDRGVSQLWVYNGQELVSIIWGTEEKNTRNLIENIEQYRFDWKMVNYRKNLILSTEDNRIFAYWQTYGGKGGVFIHELPWTITDLKATRDDLTVDYTVTVNNVTTKYSTKYQDDTPIRNYNTEWEATYPIVIGNHLLEKEESDLFCSYILPSSDTSLEFWGMANHYHFWTFKTDWSFTPTVWSQWMIDGTDFNYHFEFVEKNWKYLTFKLVWDLPAMTGQETMRLTEYLTMQEPTYIWYTEFNHFRKIWEITTTEYKEWEFRFHNLNNKLELPKSHSLQIMVRGKGNQTYTPELFALDLVANQRDRW